MSANITEEELIECLKPTSRGDECSFDEVILLLGDLCETEEAKDLVGHYVDRYYECFDNDIKYIRGLEKRIEDLEDRLKYGKRRNKEE